MRSKEILHKRVLNRIEEELNNQKQLGKCFISDNEIDFLIDEIIKDEIITNKNISNIWVKVNDKADLPKQNGMYFVIRQFSNDITIEMFNEGFTNYQGYKVTHYQPIIKPNPPTI